MRRMLVVPLVGMLLTAPAARAAPGPAPAAPEQSVLVTLADRPSFGTLPHARAARLAAVENALRAQADSSQAPLIGALRRWRRQGLVSRVRRLWIVDAIAVTAQPSVIAALRHRPDVVSVVNDAIAARPTGTGSSPAEPNIALVGAPAAWAEGARGQGVVVASLDTGVDLGHPELAATWRGSAGGWFDPYEQHAAPADTSGHGTHTMGVIVAGDASGEAVGMAPAATWIAARIFDDRGQATTSAIHRAFQWVIDPDGDPATPDAPQVVNNSWSLTTPCNLEFEPDIQALRAVGVLPVFAAGNSGPSAGSSYSPADNPGALSVGATTNGDQIAPDSSRGPSRCGGTDTTYPSLTAPGVGIRTTDLLAGYTTVSGTSLAAPEVSGALALLLSAHPGLNAAAQDQALRATAVDLGAAGPDNVFGDGRLDVAAALRSLAADTTGPSVSAVTYVDGALSATATDASSTVSGVEWFLDTDPGPGGGAAMTAVDGAFDAPQERVTATVTPLAPGRHTIGVRARDAPGNWGSATSVEVTVGPPALFADGFADGTTDAWTAVRGQARLSVLSAAALDSEDPFGLQVVVSGDRPVGVIDGTPAAESDYAARFLFDPGVTTTHGHRWVVFAGRDAAGRRVFAVEFRSNAGSRFVRAVATDGRATAWVGLTSGKIDLGVEWSSAAHVVSLDVGGMTASVAHLHNGSSRLDRVWLGPSAGLGGDSHGRLLFDAFSSTRGGVA